jgi:hypothetical protein
MKMILETVVNNLVALIAAISGLVLAWAQLLKTRAEISKIAPTKASESATAAAREDTAPEATEVQKTRSPWKRAATWFALFDVLTIVLGFTLLLLSRNSTQPVTEGTLSLYSLIVIICLAALLRSRP